MKARAVCAAALLSATAAAHSVVWPECGGPRVASVRGVEGGEAGATDVKLLSEILLENEARQGRVAYCLSDAQMSNNRNGLSFGFNQYDLATNDKAKRVLVGLLKAARAADPSLALTEADVSAVNAGRLGLPAHTLKAGADQGLVSLIRRVNTALGSPAAKTAIDADYAAWLEATIAGLRARLDGIDDAIGSRTYLSNSTLGRMLVLDYENFFGAMGPEFRRYLSGRSVTLDGGTIQAEVPASFTDLMRFSLSTKQGSGAARDQRAEILRRINNVVKFYARSPAEIGQTKRDIAWLKRDLKAILEGGDNEFIRKRRVSGQYDALMKLVAQSEQSP